MEPSFAALSLNYSTGNKFYLDCKDEGTFQIVAVQNGNKNYYSSTRIRKIVTVLTAQRSTTLPTAPCLRSEAITLSATTTVKAIAIKDGQSSEVASRVFTKSSNDDGMGQD